MRKLILASVIIIVPWLLFAEGVFTVTQYNLKSCIETLDGIESAISQPASYVANHGTKSYSQLAFASGDVQSYGVPHFYSDMVPLPIGIGSSGCFAIKVTGTIDIPESGYWTFAFGSDDGFRAEISGQGILEKSSSVDLRTFETTLHKVLFENPGKYNIRLIWFTRGYANAPGDVAGLEVSIAQGSYSSFNSSAFKLLRASADSVSYPTPANLQATQYHNQHPQGVKLTWSPVAGAPGYVIVRRILAEAEETKIIDFWDKCDYLDDISKIPNCKDLKANYAVAVAERKQDGTPVFLSPYSNIALGSWIDKGYPTIVKVDKLLNAYPSDVFLTGCTESKKEPNTITVTFGSYDTTRFRLKEVHVSASHNGTTLDFVNDWNQVSFKLPEGQHGSWSFILKAVFQDKTMGSEYVTAPISVNNVKVCFKRTGRDGIPISEVENRIMGKKPDDIAKEMPNWFKYWLRDGALDLLKDDHVFYGNNPAWETDYSDNGGVTAPNGDIHLFAPAVSANFAHEITVNGKTKHLQTEGLSSLKKCAEVVEHERGHRQMFSVRSGRYSHDNYWINLGWDEDHDGLPDIFETRFPTRQVLTSYPDLIVDSDMVFDTTTNDSFGAFPWLVARGYRKGECDEEVYVRYLATIEHRPTYFSKIIHEELDYSWENGDTSGSRNLKMASLRLSTAQDDVVYKSDVLDCLERFGGPLDAEYEAGNVAIGAIGSLTLDNTETGGRVLLATVGCSAENEQRAIIVVSLSDETGTPVAWASRTGNIAAGANNYTLEFDGNILHSSKKNGFAISRVTVCCGGNLCPIATSYIPNPTPSTFGWSDFTSDAITIQSLALSEGDGCVNVSAEIVVPNEDGVYDLSTFLCDAGTSDYVAEASQTNVVLHAGTNAVSLAFANSDIQMNAVSNAFAISKFTVEKDGEIVAAYNGDAILNLADETILNPTNAVLAFDETTVTNELVAAEGGALYSGVNFAFDVVNSHTNAVDYTLTAYLNSTNSLTVDVATFDLSLTSGVNRITIPFLGAKIRESGIDGPYVLSSVRLESKDEAIASQTLRMRSSTEDCEASNLQGDIITRLVGISRKSNRDDSIVASITFETAGAVSGIVNASLVDAENKVIMFGCTGFAADCVGSKNVEICFAVSNITESAYTMPLRIAYISIVPSDKLLPSLADDTLELVITELDYLEPVAPPSFSPATKTVFFRNGQPVVISCATPDAEIRYTLDGSEPTASSKLYDGSFVITNSVTVKAKAFVEGLSPSEMVQAEYVRAAIVGDNLVQNTSPEAGGSQIVSVPVPGAYQVSFDYTQGGDVELRLSQGGTVRTLATVSTVSGGTTNFLFDVSAAGDYELTVYDLSSGTVQPAQVSNLNMSIPNTPENNGRYWIYETENTFGSTGKWITEHGFQNGKMPVDDISTFTPYTQSDGRFVTIVSTMECISAIELEPDYDYDSKAALTCGSDGDVLVFKVLTMENGVRTWKTVGAEGLAEPALNTPYTIKLTLDCTNRTYTAAIIGDGGVEFTLTHGTTNEFAFAGQQDTAVGQVGFDGPGNVISLLGNYNNSDVEFMCGNVLPLAGGQSSQALTEGQAAWLNSMKGYNAVKAKVATMRLADFNDAYLLNLDISQSEFGLGMFKVTGIEVTDDEVRISVTLNRAGAIQVSHGGTNRDAPINGLLKLYGGETPSDRTLLNATVITDDSFSSGDTEVFTYPRSGPARFFCPAIVSP